MERAIMCPQCNAPLTPHQFARSIVCSYCGATVRLDRASVSAEKFHEAFRLWNAPNPYQIQPWISIGDQHWVLGKCIGHGEQSDVYFGQRARWPTELVIIKILRDRQQADYLLNEWDVLQNLQKSEAAGADNFARLLPNPVLYGAVTSGTHAGSAASIYRWTSGFHHNFEDVIRVYPNGIPPQASIWIWRRILEVLSFIHASGMAHGAILPEHLLIQENEHGVRVIGFAHAGKLGALLHSIPQNHLSYYPQTVKSEQKLSTNRDLAMSARCIAAIMGGNPGTAVMPASVPPKLAALVRQIAFVDPKDGSAPDAWSLREKLGALSGEVFGPARFIPIAMPS